MIVGFVSFFIHLKWLSESERKAHTNEERKLQSAFEFSLEKTKVMTQVRSPRGVYGLGTVSQEY
jgi:hypothetical protein